MTLFISTSPSAGGDPSEGTDPNGPGGGSGGSNPIDPQSAPGQASLAIAHRAGARVFCRCVEPAQEMYVAHIGKRYYVKRMPNTGEAHAPDCPAFEPPEHLSGLAALRGTAIEECADAGQTTLKLDFPLVKRGKQMAPPPAAGSPATEAISNPRKMGLTALLHYLWVEADLVKWVPGMAGKRWWGVVQHALLHAACNKQTKGLDLGAVLMIPDVFKADHAKKAKAACTKRFVAIATRSNTNPNGPGGGSEGTNPNAGTDTSLGILIAEYKSHVPTRMGAKFTFKHLPQTAFFADADLTRRFARVFEPQLALADMVEGCHIMAIATFSLAAAGYPVLHAIGLMLVTEHWIPFEHARDVDLLNRLTAEQRCFSKQMRFNLKPDATIAAAVLNDTDPAIALFVTPGFASADEIATFTALVEADGYPFWLWRDEATIPDLPVGKDRPC